MKTRWEIGEADFSPNEDDQSKTTVRLTYLAHLSG